MLRFVKTALRVRRAAFFAGVLGRVCRRPCVARLGNRQRTHRGISGVRWKPLNEERGGG